MGLHDPVEPLFWEKLLARIVTHMTICLLHVTLTQLLRVSIRCVVETIEFCDFY